MKKNLSAENIYPVLEAKLKLSSEKVVVKQLCKGEWVDWTATSLLDWIAAISDQLFKLGVKKGMRIGILAESSPEWIVAALSIWKLRGTAALLSNMVTPKENIIQIRQTDLSAVLITPKMYEEFKDALPNEVPVFILKKDLETVEELGRPNTLALPNIPDLDPDIAVMVLTSGTTGVTKVVLQKHKALLAQAYNPIYTNHYKESDPLFSVLPYFHIYPLVSNVILTIYQQVCIVQIDELNLDNIQKAFKDIRPRGMITTPRLLEAVYVKIKLKMSGMTFKQLNRLCNLLRFSYWLHRKWKIRLFGKLIFKDIYQVFGGRMKNITCGGAPLDPFLMEFYEACGMEIHVGYGLSETTGPITYSVGEERIPSAVGSQVPGIDLEIMDPDGEGVGEIRAKGDLIMAEYFRNPEDTAMVLKNEWFQTGDVGYLDAKNNLFLTGRLKELIVSSTGKKTSPIEIETLFTGLPFVEEIVALGVQSKDGSGDEAYLAMVINEKLESNLNREEKIKKIRTEVNKRNLDLPQRLRVRQMYFTDQFPKTNLEKVKRRALAEAIIIDRKKEELDHLDLTPFKGDSVQMHLMNILQHISQSKHKKSTVEMHLDEFGMDSLMALQFFNLLKQKYHEKIIADWIYANPTVAELAKAIKSGEAPFLKKKVGEERDVHWYKNFRWKRSAGMEEEYRGILKTETILLTGATGVLGGKLLLDILLNTNAKVICLIRPKNEISAMNRLLNILELYNGGQELDTDWLKRIQVFEGDLTLDDFGLEKTRYEFLVSETDAVIHSAAKVSLHGVYPDVADSNVGSTQKIIEFTLKTEQKYLLYVSSYSMFGDGMNKLDFPLTEMDMDVGQRFMNLGYQQSKFESEILVRSVKGAGLKWIIVRPGDIYGDSKTGLYPLGITSVGGIYYEMLKTIAETQVVAKSDRFYDITPVDYVSQGIIHFLFKHPFLYGTYHLKNPQIIRFSDLVTVIKQIGLPLKEVSIEEYQRMLKDNAFVVDGKIYDNPALGLIKYRPEEFLGNTKTYVDSRRTAEVLAKYDIFCPEPNIDLLQTYLSYCIQIGFLKV